MAACANGVERERLQGLRMACGHLAGQDGYSTGMEMLHGRVASTILSRLVAASINRYEHCPAREDSYRVIEWHHKQKSTQCSHGYKTAGSF
jgi:hypothetical protein